MCKETKEELKKGTELAKQLLKHLKSMGAAQCEIPVTDIDGVKYWIKIKQADDSEYSSDEILTREHIKLNQDQKQN